MRPDAEKDGAKWATKNDNRVTSIGNFIRKYRIDELPQLLNVIKGEMSFIGPRPERPEFVQQLVKEVPYYNQRHNVKPGLAGWAQLNYPYGASVKDSLEKFVQLSQSKNEIENRLEQLRALDNNIDINVSLAKSSPIGASGASPNPPTT